MTVREHAGERCLAALPRPEERHDGELGEVAAQQVKGCAANRTALVHIE
jgi:hypothetical protein